MDKDSESSIGPSAFQGTERPYLSRLFDMGSQEILQLGLREQLSDVDSYILGLVKERNWVDNKASYVRVLDELKVSLGVDPSLQPLIVLERLAKGVKLLKLQRMHKRRSDDINKYIQKQNAILNT